MRNPVRQHFPGRQAFLFVVAILVPCAVLIALGLRLIDQERQLEDKRHTDERRQSLVQISQELFSRLERIKLLELSRAVSGAAEKSSKPIVLVARLSENALLLPWENAAAIQRFADLISEPDFARLIQQAETEELVTRRYRLAGELYRQARESAHAPEQQVYASLLRARAMEKDGDHAQSLLEYERVLSTPAALVDEHGIPMALYAASALSSAPFQNGEILDRVRSVIDQGLALNPAAIFLARDLAATLNAQALEMELNAMARRAEQAEALQRDAGRLAAIREGRDSVWISFGEHQWLIGGASAPAASDTIVVAVDAAEILADLKAADATVRLANHSDATVEELGENFPGLRISRQVLETRAGGRQTFFAVALFFAVMLTLLAGYLFWRDVQRDFRVTEMRSQFISNVTHELRTPLTAIRMFSETLRLDDDVDRQTRNEYLDTIQSETERLTRLVENVLEFGKIERGGTYAMQPVRLDEVVDRAARAFKHSLESLGFDLEVAIEREIPAIPANADALQQAILNLLSNATKYSGDSRNIRLLLHKQNSDARIQVVDGGIGIAPYDRDRILERFYRAPSVESLRIPGTGLGLSLVDYIAKAHGGTVEVESSEGHGSTFTIRLPLTQRTTG